MPITAERIMASQAQVLNSGRAELEPKRMSP